MKYESNTIKSVVLSLLFSASYEIRKENYQISSSFFFFRLGNRQFANSLMCLRTWLWRSDGTEPEIGMLQILNVSTTEHAKTGNESFTMIGTLGEELWRNVPDFSAVFGSFFAPAPKLYAVYLGDFYHARYKCTKDYTRLKNFFRIVSEPDLCRKKISKKMPKKKQFVIIPTWRCLKCY